MPSIRATVDYLLVSTGSDAKPGSAIGKVGVSDRLDIDTGEPPEGNDQAEYMFWFDTFHETETSEVLLRRSMWVSMAEQALGNRDGLDLVLHTANDNATRVTSLVLVAKGAPYKKAIQ